MATFNPRAPPPPAPPRGQKYLFLETEIISEIFAFMFGTRQSCQIRAPVSWGGDRKPPAPCLLSFRGYTPPTPILFTNYIVIKSELAPMTLAPSSRDQISLAKTSSQWSSLRGAFSWVLRGGRHYATLWHFQTLIAHHILIKSSISTAWPLIGDPHRS